MFPQMVLLPIEQAHFPKKASSQVLSEMASRINIKNPMFKASTFGFWSKLW